jgi:hypothetical protein
MRSIMILLGAILAPGITAAETPPLAQTPPPAQTQAADARFVSAVQIFQRASRGESGEVEPAIAAFEALLASDTRNPVYLAYFGAASSLRGREAWMPWNKLKYTEAGLDYIDRALAMLKPEHDRQLLRGAPASIETRLVAAATFLKLPESIFHRRGAGKRLVADLLKHPAFAASPAPLRAAIYSLAAEAARGEQQEVAQLKQVLAVAPTGREAEQARARLKELRQ